MSVGQPQQWLLNQFGDLVQDAFGTRAVYHVGSSMGQEKAAWRDVDVRLLLSEEEWDRMGLPTPDEWGTRHDDPKWRALCLVFSRYGQQVTGLPIDFQIQRITEANAKYPGNRSYCGTINHKPEPKDDLICRHGKDAARLRARPLRHEPGDADARGWRGRVRRRTAGVRGPVQ